MIIESALSFIIPHNEFVKSFTQYKAFQTVAETDHFAIVGIANNEPITACLNVFPVNLPAFLIPFQVLLKRFHHLAENLSVRTTFSKAS